MISLLIQGQKTRRAFRKATIDSLQAGSKRCGGDSPEDRHVINYEAQRVLEAPAFGQGLRDAGKTPGVEPQGGESRPNLLSALTRSRPGHQAAVSSEMRGTGRL